MVRWQHFYQSEHEEGIILMNQERTIWGFYPGKHEGAGGDFGDADVFSKKQLIGIGWPLTGRLDTLSVERCPLSDFAAVVRKAYQNERDIPTWEAKKRDKWIVDSARVLYRFLFEAQPGDIVVYACKRDEQVYIGRIKDTEEGRYKYVEPTEEPLHWHCRHFRAVDWLNQVPYADCSKQELAQARTQNKFWRMKACPDKFLATFWRV